MTTTLTHPGETMPATPNPTDITWLPELPQPTNPGLSRDKIGKYQAFFDACRANPGKWALMYKSPTRNSSLQTGVKNGLLRGSAPAGSFEAATRVIDNQSHTFVRFIGDPASTDQRTNGHQSPSPNALARAKHAQDAAIREWAKALGLPVNDYGRIPSYVRDAYNATHRQ